jgi:hypothetical protein
MRPGDFQCLEEDILSEDSYKAKESMVAWNDAGGRIGTRSYIKFRYPLHAPHLADNGTTWYVCNCKPLWCDPVPRAELDEVERILADNCGPNRSGRIWSHKWQKEYNVVTTAWIESRWRGSQSRYIDICPWGCFGSGGGGPI